MITLARRVADVRGSAIRDLLTLTARPDVISLAGGLPAGDPLPRERIAVAADRALPGPRRCSTPRPPVSRRCARPSPRTRPPASGRPVAPSEVVVTSGSQQALDLLARALSTPATPSWSRTPPTSGRCRSSRPRAPTCIGVPLDADGMRVDVLAERLAAGLRPRLVHTVSSFHNPRGVTLAPDRRRRAGRARRPLRASSSSRTTRTACSRSTARPPGRSPPTATGCSASAARPRSSHRRCGSGWLTGPTRRRRAPSSGSSRAPTCAAPRSPRRSPPSCSPTPAGSTRTCTTHPRGDGGPGTGLHRGGRRPAPRRHVHDADRRDVLLAGVPRGGVRTRPSSCRGRSPRASAFVPGAAFAVHADQTRAARCCYASVDEATLAEAVARLASCVSSAGSTTVAGSIA